MAVYTMEKPSPRQAEFFCARARYVAYGGARGGGKSWAVRRKAALLALNYAGIRILVLRRTFPELRENHILPMRAELHGIAAYKESDKAFTFPNGSRVLYGYCDTDADVQQYQGQQYDIIFIDEATQFTEYQYSTLTACIRGVNDFPKRMYLTCNPGGVGHAWVKRLFVDRDFRGSERGEDYVFIQAKVTDNPALMAKDPEYVNMLRNLPPGLREAWLEGRWDVFAGQFFTEFDRDIHVCEPFEIPPHWRRYVAMDYGMDMLAAYVIAVDEQNHAYVTREVYDGRDREAGAKGLIVSEAAQRVKDMVGDDDIYLYLAPPDLWSARQETGKSVAQLFLEAGITLTQASNDRVDGWMAVREKLKKVEGADGEDDTGLRIFRGCANLIRTLPLLQYDDKKPNDAAKEPHEVTHAPDALRYFCVYWTRASAAPASPEAEWSAGQWADYRNARTREEKDYLIKKWGRPKR